uniref:Uncharacterized protein n=1 Tax=Arundo donax TaxID=35708 RepID=A0A0A9BRM0_ARUDO
MKKEGSKNSETA